MTYFSGYIRKKRHASAIGLLAGIALCAAVAWIVFLATSKNMAANLKESNLDKYSLAVFILFTIAALVVAFTKRFKVTIAQEESDGSLFMQIADPALPSPLIIRDPVTISKQWMEVNLGRGNKMKNLYVTMYDTSGNSLVTFTGALGNFYDAPDGFIHVAPDQINKATLIYDSSKIQDIAYALWCHEDYLKLKQKRKTP